MAPPLAAQELSSPITTRSPRTSLIDAEWEWLARRAETADAGDTVAFAERDTAPGLAPFPATAAVSWPHEAAPASAAWLSFRVKIAFIATALCSFALGVVALPLATSVAQRVQLGSSPAQYVAQLDRAHANGLPATPATEPIREALERDAPQHESAVASPAQPEETVAPARAKPPSAAKPSVARSARRHGSPPPRRSAPSDNPY